MTTLTAAETRAPVHSADPAAGLQSRLSLGTTLSTRSPWRGGP